MNGACFIYLQYVKNGCEHDEVKSQIMLRFYTPINNCSVMSRHFHILEPVSDSVVVYSLFTVVPIVFGFSCWSLLCNNRITDLERTAG